jgi:hypothetical protein
MSDSDDELNNTTQISRERNVSGELFDLSVPTFNNHFGNESIKYAIKFGTAYPLQKYIDELESILKGPSADDDKAPKRRIRLDFLYYCNNNIYIRCLFQDFMAYLNGAEAGLNMTRRHAYFQQYKNQYHIVTVAGGNVFILFAQLLLNMVDTLVTCADDIGSDKNLDRLNWDIVFGNQGENYNIHQTTPEGEEFLETEFDDWSDRYWWTLNNGYNYLSYTNKLLLINLSYYDFGKSKEQLWYHIATYILDKKLPYTSGSANDLTFQVAMSHHSDFDYKLTPNIHPDIDPQQHHETIDFETLYGDGDDGGGGDDDDDISHADEIITEMKEELDSVQKLEDGFLLIRAKTLIIVEDIQRYYTTAQLRKFKHECARPADAHERRGLGSIAYGLYPQIMQDSYLSDIDRTDNPDCYRFLKHLQEKKRLIEQATRNNISEINKFFLAGVYKAVDRNGRVYSVSNLRQQENSTESLIFYLNKTTYAINKYIEAWEWGRISHWAAPGLRIRRNLTISDLKITYDDVCHSFLTLDNLMNSGESLIPRLCSDILFYFVNDPIFQTEAILDSLIQTVNNDRIGRPQAYMPESVVTIAPNQPITFNDSLTVMKNIFERISSRDTDGMTAMPNGLRITMNVVVSEPQDDTNLDMDDYIFDYNGDNIEEVIESIERFQIDTYNSFEEVPHSHYISFNKKQPFRGGGKNNKKRKTRKNRKYKRTIKSKKNKTKAKKIRRTKKNRKIKKNKVTKSKKISKKN